MEQQYNIVFVYGTLRKGLRNHHYLRRARFLGHGRTVEPFLLYAGDVPYVYRPPAGAQQRGAQVRGEVYALDATDFAAVDRLEEHPDDYCRERTIVLLEGAAPEGGASAGGELIEAWLYFHPEPEGEVVASGDIFDAPPAFARRY